MKIDMNSTHIHTLVLDKEPLYPQEILFTL